MLLVLYQSSLQVARHHDSLVHVGIQIRRSRPGMKSEPSKKGYHGHERLNLGVVLLHGTDSSIFKI